MNKYTVIWLDCGGGRPESHYEHVEAETPEAAREDLTAEWEDDELDLEDSVWGPVFEGWITPVLTGR